MCRWMVISSCTYTCLPRLHVYVRWVLLIEPLSVMVHVHMADMDVDSPRHYLNRCETTQSRLAMSRAAPFAKNVCA